MNFIELLKKEFPLKAELIKELAELGAIDEITSKKAIAKNRVKNYRGRKQDFERNLADELCCSHRTIQRYLRDI